jgi:hypothetical protein
MFAGQFSDISHRESVDILVWPQKKKKRKDWEARGWLVSGLGWQDVRDSAYLHGVEDGLQVCLHVVISLSMQAS